MYEGLIAVLPEIIISTMSCFILILDLFLAKKNKKIVYYLTQITLLSIIVLSFQILKIPHGRTLYGAFVFDFNTLLYKFIIISSAYFIFAYSRKSLENIDLFKGEYFVLCMLSILGMMIMISSGNFLTLYLGLELLSLPIYSLIIMNKSYVSSEASMKYFIMGSIASGIFLFGVSLTYGMAGSIDFNEVAHTIYDDEVFSNITLQYGLAFIIAGLIFKFGAVPFHMWVPDVYEGSPITITTFIGTIPKIAALGMAYRIIDTFAGLNSEAEFFFIVIGGISLFLGNIFAMSQIDIKRMLAYSTIAHVGFIFLGFSSCDTMDFGAVTFYVFIYVLSALCAFGVIIITSNKNKESNLILDFKGLGINYPALGIIMMLAIFSLAGIPPTAGFFAKFFVIKSIMLYGLIEVALFAVLMSVLGSYYYLNIIRVMYFETNTEKNIAIDYGMSNLSYYLLIINAALILILGIFPEYFFLICA